MYHQHHEQQQQQPQQETNGYPSNAVAAGSTASDLSSASASNLDHALLESLFYNEMSIFDSTTLSLPTEHDTPHTIVEKEILRDFGVGGGTTLFHVPAPSPPEPPLSTDTAQYNNVHTNPQNDNTANASSYTNGVLPQVPPLQQQQQQQLLLHHHQQHSTPLHHQAPPPSSTMPQYTSNGSTNYPAPSGGTTNTSAAAKPSTTSMAAVAANPRNTQSSSQLAAPVYMDIEATATAAAAAAVMLSGGNNGEMKVQATATIPGIASPNTTRKAASLGAYSNSHSSHPTPPIGASSPSMVSSTINGIVTQQQQRPKLVETTNHHTSASSKPGARVQVPENRARQLVDQFATLASRLGIDLPNSVLQSLTSAAAKNDPTLLTNEPSTSNGAKTVATTTATTASSKAMGTIALNSVIKSSEITLAAAAETKSDGASEITAIAPTVMELRNMAEEAIAAVTQSSMKRSVSKENLSLVASSQEHPASNADIKPTYSKRRKKPRLSDCEAKLARLKAENEQLKRHLQNVSNKAHKFDMEKEEAGKQIARFMHDPNVDSREMEASVRKFSDMYSDYGINRQQELSFHLDQLQRLVNPTNFTKMGLWTLGQTGQGSKKNPIAGILVKELDITPQQGRKILDQSEKIRKLCDNLKEAHALLVKLKYLCEKKTRTFQDRMNKCTEILTSKQVVKLICWINVNAQLLENVCPGWGTEHIQSKK